MHRFAAKITEATAVDNQVTQSGDTTEGRYGQAIGLYMQGIEYFNYALKREWPSLLPAPLSSAAPAPPALTAGLASTDEKNPKSQETLKARMEQYITRVEKLRGVNVAPPPAPPKKAAAAGDGKAGGGGGGKDEDDEKSKFREGLASVINTESPNVKWDDVAGLMGAKESLKEAVILPIRFPQLFQGKRKPWRGILLYGPPGTGKSYLAKACATEAESTFFSVTSSDLVSKWLGESEKLVATLFAMAREQKPSIVFICEVDSLCSARGDGESESARRIKTQFLTEMDGVGSDMDGILVLGATNLPWGLDKAMLRRFERRVYIPLPEEVSVRATMVRINVGTTANAMQDADWEEVGRGTQGYSGADMQILVRDAMMEPIRQIQTATHFVTCAGTDRDGNHREDMLKACSPGAPGAQEMTMMDISDPSKLLEPPLDMDHFRAIIEKSHPSVAEEDLAPFIEFTENYGQEGA